MHSLKYPKEPKEPIISANAAHVYTPIEEKENPEIALKSGQ